MLSSSLEHGTSHQHHSLVRGPSADLVALEELQDNVRTLLFKIAAKPQTRKLVSSLQQDDAQCIVDYLDQLLFNHGTLDARQGRHLLSLLVEIAKYTQVFPASRELKGVRCDLRKPLAGGGCGYIYQGMYDGQVVCVKAVHRWVEQDPIMDSLIQTHTKDLVLCSHLSHPNVLPFYGIFHSDEELSRICIVSPWMDNGDLVRFLKKSPQTPKMPLIYDIISGLEYLHGCGIIHGDLKANNILISNDKLALIADFGISSVVMTHASVHKNVGGTQNWMAPELSVEDAPRATVQSDIWSFACVCYEIFTGKTPFHEYQIFSHLVVAFLNGHVTPFTPRKGEDKDDKALELRGVDPMMLGVMHSCWARSAEERPSTEAVRQTIKKHGEVMGSSRLQADNPLQRLAANIDLPGTRTDYERMYGILSRTFGSSVEISGQNVGPIVHNHTSTQQQQHRLDTVDDAAHSEGSLRGDGGAFAEPPEGQQFHESESSQVSCIGPFENLSSPVGSRLDVVEGPRVSVGNPSPVHHTSNESHDISVQFSSNIIAPPLRSKFGLSNTIMHPSQFEGQGYPDLTGLIKVNSGQFPVHTGGFSDIYVGFMREKVAIKVLRTTDEKDQIDTIRRRLNREAVVWHKLRHRNVLPFLGLASNMGRFDSCPALIAPYCSNGTSGDYVRRSDPSIETRILLILGIARGLEYLHEEGIVHGDLKPSNVLMGDNYEPLVYDFGLSKIINLRGFTTKPVGTVRYQARELLEGAVMPNQSTDVCAFGLTALELWTSLRPYAEIRNDNAVIRHIIIGNGRPQLPDPLPAKAECLWPILMSCLSHAPKDRPGIRTVMQQLETLSSFFT